MSDFISCPTCHGKGLVPVETAAPIEVHTDAERQAERDRQRQREQDALDARNADRRPEMAERQARMESLLRYGRTAGRPTIVIEPTAEEDNSQ